MSNLVKALIIVAIVVAGVIVFLNSQGDPGPAGDPGSGGTPVVDDGPKPDRGGNQTPVRQIPLADEKTVAITGQVLNDNDQVLSGVKILAYSMTGGTGQNNLTLVGEKVSSDVGAFQFDALRAGKYRFVARTEGYQEGRIERTLIVDQTADPIDFVLSSGLAISGKVLDVAGAPIAGAEVTAFLERVRETAGLQERLQQLLKIQELQSEVGITAVTDSSGEYQLQGLENEHYRLRVIAPRHSPATRRYVRAGSTDVNFALEIGGELTGIVRGTDGGPISDADLYIYKQDSEDVDIIEVVLQRLYPPLAAVSTGPGGEYVFDQLGAGMEYRLVTTASGFQPVETQKIVVSTGGSTTLDLSLEKGKSIAGYVYGPDGAPLEGARVKVNLTGARSATPQIALTDQGVQTSAEGYFIFDTLEDGEYRVVASHDAYATFQQQKVSPDTAELAITLSEGAAISGTVRDAGTGAAIAGAIITVREPAGVEKKATTDASGLYMVRGVTVPRRGEARLGCTADGYAREGNASAPVTDGSVTEGFDFAMRANGTVSGVVLDTAGAKVSGARVEVKRQNDPNMPIYVTVGGPVTSGSDGSYT
ncbi:MAG: carboxypeptidase-like regulatory domain-containing protein, partial [Planctomycetota bacterium]